MTGVEALAIVGTPHSEDGGIAHRSSRTTDWAISYKVNAIDCPCEMSSHVYYASLRKHVQYCKINIDRHSLISFELTILCFTSD
ncbi:hypothetical protein TNIN_301331 [Trichonephila inaurata madagascariensis]|uniref:Uncharacterized protein n=1 Tax=Trichonephila inaurata madagascariensis TaxID=2747483 RepID=A0A8X6YHC6_9ARAC|nr:hypothetical protein TNIN_301331 [Trichonephila inaurata madagascariensis]